MANIASGFNKRGHRELYEGRYNRAIEYFYKSYLMDNNTDNMLDLIYALNQNADYIKALEYCYSLFGMENVPEKDMLLFLAAESFGGTGCIEGCGQMLQLSLKTNSEGKASRDAIAFLEDLKNKYSIDEIKDDSVEISIGYSNSITEAPFISMESFQCLTDVSALCKENLFEDAIKRIEKEIEQGDFSVGILSSAIMIGAELNDKDYMERCAERFRFVEDYTLSEIRTLAYDLNDLNNTDIAYTVYKELYSKESGERDIAYGFAVACEKIGDVDYAKEIMEEVVASSCGIGCTKFALENIGKGINTYVMRFPEIKENEFKNLIESDRPLPNDRYYLDDMFEYIRFAKLTTVEQFIGKIDVNDFYNEILLRRMAIAPEVTLFARAKAAEVIYNMNKKVYLNTGTDIVEFSPAINTVINGFFERNFKYESTD